MNIEFNEDGSLKLPDNVKKEISDMEIEIPDYIKVLKLLSELEFSVGRKLLAEILRGETSSKIKRLGLASLFNHGALDLYGSKDIQELLDKMILNGLIEIKKLPKNKFMPVISITQKGKLELEKPIKNESCLDTFKNCIKRTCEITDED
jgi:superfamily II DNA helicase RecQ